MNIEELVAGFKEKGMSDEEIKVALESIKTEIDNFLNPKEEEDVKIEDDVEKEDEESKMNKTFGLNY